MYTLCQTRTESEAKVDGIRCRYGDGTMRLTVEENILFPNVPEDKLEAIKKEPLFQKYRIDAGPLTRGLVSCTGAQVTTRPSSVYARETFRLANSKKSVQKGLYWRSVRLL